MGIEEKKESGREMEVAVVAEEEDGRSEWLSL